MTAYGWPNEIAIYVTLEGDTITLSVPDEALDEITGLQEKMRNAVAEVSDRKTDIVIKRQPDAKSETAGVQGRGGKR